MIEHFSLPTKADPGQLVCELGEISIVLDYVFLAEVNGEIVLEAKIADVDITSAEDLEGGIIRVTMQRHPSPDATVESNDG